MRQKTNRAGRRLRLGSVCRGSRAPDAGMWALSRRKQEAAGKAAWWSSTQHAAPAPTPTPPRSPPPPATSSMNTHPFLPSTLPCGWAPGQRDLGHVPAVVPDTSPPPPRMPLVPHGLGPRDLRRGLTLTPKSRGVRKPGGHATFKYTEHRACPGSVLPRYVCGVDPCPCFLETPM